LPPWLAAAVSALVAAAAWRSGTLTMTGAWTAWAIGSLVLIGTGWEGGAVLAAFFVSSNLIERVGSRPAGLESRGECRDHRQVVANGGLAALGAVLGLQYPGLGMWLVTGTLAAAAADTWATAVGGHSRRQPRLFWSGQPVPAGTNGGLTWLGSAGAATGALVVATVGALGAREPLLLPVATLIGFAGMLVDSALGASLQGRFRCPACARTSERRIHRCGAATVHQGGLPWLDNDLVNLTATAAACGMAFAAWWCLTPSL
jgi:uncharacterized protein (TIGR00297 family)